MRNYLNPREWRLLRRIIGNIDDRVVAMITSN
jgi:hypothetical protein